MIYIYLKTHKKTGLKYLGKTVQDPFTYKGSGQRWRKHLAKHGNDVDTQILFESNDIEQIRQQGKYYSKLWNIVEDQSFANLVPESGDGGDTSESPNYKTGIKSRDTSGSKNSMYGRSAIVEQNIKWYNNGVENIYVSAGTEPKGFSPGRIIDYKKPHKAESKSLISKANSRACVSPIGEIFNSRKEAAKAYNISAPAIGGLISRGKSGWHWL